jgi:hypothetical protein
MIIVMDGVFMSAFMVEYAAIVKHPGEKRRCGIFAVITMVNPY